MGNTGQQTQRCFNRVLENIVFSPLQESLVCSVKAVAFYVF